MLRHCLAPSLRDQLNELPKSLDATYERVLDEIQSTNQGRHAHRLLQCLTVAMRPLDVKELAEVLAFELDTGGGEPPRYHPDWRWEDQEYAVLSVCSSLITVVYSYELFTDTVHRHIQFSHFSVKEYLTSKRLSTACVDASRYHIALEPAHLVIARACLGVLLCPIYDDSWPESTDSLGHSRPQDLLEYAADHWASHAQVGNVSSLLKDAIKTLFDPNKRYFSYWRQIRDYDSDYEDEDDDFNQGGSPLYFAALYGFYDTVQFLIDGYPKMVTNHNRNGFSPLLAALGSRAREKRRVAELLVKHGARVNIRRDPPLCHATHFSDNNRVNAMQFLLKHGAHVNVRDKKHMTPLHFAAQVGCPEVARMLLEHGADVDLQTVDGQVPLHLVSYQKSHVEDEGKRLVLARLLLAGSTNVNARDAFGETPLHKASYNRRPKIAQLLLDHGANAHAKNVQGRNSLHLLSLSIHSVDSQDVHRLIEVLLGQGVDVNVVDKDHETPLHIASSFGKLKIAQLLLTHGAKADAENVQGQTPLHIVCPEKKLFEIDAKDVGGALARLLLQQLGVDVNARDKHLDTPLHFASSSGHSEIALALLDHGANVNAHNSDGQTPLHRVTLHTGGEFPHQLAQVLLEHGADVNARDKDQATPLHFASYTSKLGTIRVLLENGANIHTKNIQGQTPLHIVSQGDHNTILSKPVEVELFLSRGADVNVRDEDQATPFLLASFGVRRETAEILLQNGADVNAVNIHGQNAWHLVSQSQNLYFTDYYQDGTFGRLLLRHRLDIHKRDKDEKTPLHFACYFGRIDIAEILLENGAQVSAVDIRGHTPLHQVPLGNHEYEKHDLGLNSRYHPSNFLRLAQRLLESGAELNAQNKDHETPLHLASRLQLHNITQFLLNNGADINVKNSEGKSPLQLAQSGDQNILQREHNT